MDRVCCYHAGCPDGFGAAFSVWSAWGDEARYVARGHDDRCRASDHAGALIAFVDIAPDNSELRELAEHAAQIVILDHHVTSRARFETDIDLANALGREGHVVCFDMERSGAVLAWRYFMAAQPVPDLLLYVQDQDLWTWKLPASQEVNAAIGSYPHEFEVWAELAARPIEDLAREGEPIVRANRVEVQRVLRKAAPVAIGSLRVEAVNATTNRSAVGHELAERAVFGAPWGCVYRVDGNRVMATLYSIGDFDVAKIATSLGGGGHRNAAGFSVTLEEWVSKFAC